MDGVGEKIVAPALAIQFLHVHAVYTRIFGQRAVFVDDRLGSVDIKHLLLGAHLRNKPIEQRYTLIIVNFIGVRLDFETGMIS